MSTLLKRLQLAIGTGAALCAPTVACNDATVKSDAGRDASSDASTTDAGTYELTQLGCSGPFYDGGYYGQCCVDALCYTPTASACMAADDPLLRSTLVGFPPGSGSCSCAELGAEAVSGPYAPNPSNPDEPDGSCCYLVGSISCEGRPLCVEGEQVVAAVVVRNDWSIG